MLLEGGGLPPFDLSRTTRAFFLVMGILIGIAGFGDDISVTILAV